MKIMFFGLTKKDEYSFEFFEKMNKYNLFCDVDFTENSIIVYNVPQNLRATVINDIRKIFDIEMIRTQADDTQKSTEDCTNNMTDSYINAEINNVLADFSHSLKNSSLSVKEKLGFVKSFHSELDLLRKSKKLDVEEGDIVLCKLKFSLKGESFGTLNFLVQKKLSDECFLGIPLAKRVNMHPSGGVTNISYTNDTNNIMQAILLVTRIQPISCYRCIKKVGEVANKNVLDVIAGKLCTYTKRVSKEQVVTKFVRSALFSYNTPTNQDEKLQNFFSKMQIPENMELLRTSFAVATLAEKLTLKNIVSLIKQNCSSVAELEESTIAKHLRKEFLTWIDMLPLENIKGHDKISLITFLNAFASFVNVK